MVGKIIKKFFKIVGITILVIIILAIILPIIFEKQIVRKVKEEANKNMKATLDFKDYGLSLFKNFPNFTLSLNDFTIAGIDDFKNDTLVKVKKFQATVDVMSVIKGDAYKIKSISMINPDILLKVLPNGKANWDIAKPSADTSTTQPAAEEPSNFKISLQRLSIDNAKIVYHDLAEGTKARIFGLNHTLKGDFTADFTTLDTKTKIDSMDVIYDGVKYLNKTYLKADVILDADLKNSKYTFKKNEFQVNQLFFGFDGFIALKENEDMEMDLKFDIKKTEFKNILSMIPALYAKDFEKIETKGNLVLNGMAKGIYNEKRLPEFNLELKVDDAMFKYPDLPQAVTNIFIDTKISNPGGSEDNTIINVSKFHFQMANNPVDIRILVKTPVSDPQIDASIKGTINLNNVKQFYPLEAGEELSGNVVADLTMKGRMSSVEKEKYDEFEALGKLVLAQINYKSKDFPQGVTISNAEMKASPKFFELVSFNSKIGKNDFSANGRIDNILSYIFKGDLLKGTFSTNSNLMDLNVFLAESASSTSTTTASSESSSMSVVEVPGNLDFVLSSKFGKLIYDNIEMTNVNGKITIRDKKIMLENLSMNLLDGQMTMNGTYSTQDITKPTVDFAYNIQNFDIPKTFKTFNTVQKMAPVGQKASGKFSTNLAFITVLDEHMSPVVNSMEGKGMLSSTRVILSGYAPAGKLAEALKMDKFKTLALNNFKFNFKFSEGKITIDPFDMGLDQTKATFGGWSSFDGNINYTMNMDIPKSQFGGQANSVLNNMVSQANKQTGTNVTVGDKVFVDVMITGTGKDPQVKVGLKGALNDAAKDMKDQLKEQVDNKKQEIENQAKAEADRLKKEAEEKAQQEADRLKKEAEEKAKQEADRLKKEAEEKAKKEAGNQVKKLWPPKK